MRNFVKLSAMLLTVAGCVITIPTIRVVAEDESRRCTLTVLPAEMQSHIRTNYPSWRLQDVPTLSGNARERWQSEKPVGCPGIAVGQLEKANQKSYAVLLVPASKPDSGYRLLIFTPDGSEPKERFKTVEQSDKIGASNFFVHSIQISKVFSTGWVKKLRANAPDAILFVDAGQLEYETDVYFWTGGKYRREPIDH